MNLPAIFKMGAGIVALKSRTRQSVFAQEKKTVAVLDPICRDNSVNAFFQQMVRGAMESAVTASDEYEAYDRSAFDMIQKEQAFQRTGAVNDSQIKKMGEMAGVDYVLVSEVSAYEGYLSAIVKILNVTTGKYDKSVDDYSQLNPEAVKKKCNEMASSLFGSLRSGSSSRLASSAGTARGNGLSQGQNGTTNVQVTIPSNKSTTTAAKTQYGIPTFHTGNEYVDLGLPSGTLWKAENENCGLINHEQAVALYGNSLPTLEQMAELVALCTWTWVGDGYSVTGKNGHAIILPVCGYSDVLGAKYYTKKQGYYWASTAIDSENQTAKLNEKQTAKVNEFMESQGGMYHCLFFNSKSFELRSFFGNCGVAIRLVK